jgi:hypothetical protein
MFDHRHGSAVVLSLAKQQTLLVVDRMSPVVATIVASPDDTVAILASCP